jgi:hypothetical protein
VLLQNFKFRGVKPGSPDLLSWRSKHSGECMNFVIGGPSEFYSLCPGRFTGLYAPGTVSSWKGVVLRKMSSSSSQCMAQGIVCAT